MALRSRFLRTLVTPSALGFLALVGILASVGASASPLVERVEAKYADVTTLKADFVQTNTSELFGEEVQKGELLLKRPAMMRWAFGDEKQFVTDGKSMWIYTAADKQVIEYADISGNRTAADSLLQSLDKLDEFFTVKILASDDAKGHSLQLTPKEEGQFKNLKLSLDAELTVSGVVMTDAFDNVTDIAFSKVELNAPAEDSAFQFKAPEGVEVIKN